MKHHYSTSNNSVKQYDTLAVCHAYNKSNSKFQ